MDGTRFILAGRLIDGSGANVCRNVFLAVKDDRIVTIGSAADLPCNDPDLVDDFSHCTIVPALVDCSIFLSRSPSVERQIRSSTEEADFSKKAAIVERHIRYCHAHGVQGVAENEDIADLMKGYQEGIWQGHRIDIRTPVHLDQNSGDRVTGTSAGGDYFKIAYSGNIDDAEAPPQLFTREDLCRILQHKNERKAVVVANGQQQVKEALEAGCDAIEQGYAMGEVNLRTMAEKGILWIPSALRAKNALDGSASGGDVCCRFSLRYVSPGKAIPGAEAFWKKVLAKQLTQLHHARILGIPTAVGTGAGSVGILHGESVVEEMKLFIKAGYSLEETIHCASDNGARFFGMDNLGRLAVGQKATFLITRGTQKQLPRKLSYLEGIYVDGLPSIAYQKNPGKTV